MFRQLEPLNEIESPKNISKKGEHPYFVSNFDFKSQIGKNIFSFYQKSLSNDRVILANSAMPNMEGEHLY